MKFFKKKSKEIYNASKFIRNSTIKIKSLVRYHSVNIKFRIGDIIECKVYEMNGSTQYRFYLPKNNYLIIPKNRIDFDFTNRINYLKSLE